MVVFLCANFFRSAKHNISLLTDGNKLDLSIQKGEVSSSVPSVLYKPVKCHHEQERQYEIDVSHTCVELCIIRFPALSAVVDLVGAVYLAGAVSLTSIVGGRALTAFILASISIEVRRSTNAHIAAAQYRAYVVHNRATVTVLLTMMGSKNSLVPLGARSEGIVTPCTEYLRLVSGGLQACTIEGVEGDEERTVINKAVTSAVDAVFVIFVSAATNALVTLIVLRRFHCRRQCSVTKGVI